MLIWSITGTAWPGRAALLAEVSEASAADEPVDEIFRLRVEGADRLPDAPIVIAPNHASYLDAPAIVAALPWQRLRQTYWGG